MWRASSHDAEQIRLLRRARERLDLFPLAIHVNYLVNLASRSGDPRPVDRLLPRRIRARSSIGAEYLVLHPGSYKGQSLEEGIAAFGLGLRDAASGVRATTGVTVLVENTVGCGAQIGGRFEELRAIRDNTSQLTDLPVGYCLDTCHLLAAGYDVSCAAGLRETVAQADRILGIGNVKLIHANDSKTPLGSHADRHANIGEGHIGKAGFRRILAHPKLRSKPSSWKRRWTQEGDDRRNLENLKKLCPKSRTTTTRSS